MRTCPGCGHETLEADQDAPLTQQHKARRRVGIVAVVLIVFVFGVLAMIGVPSTSEHIEETLAGVSGVTCICEEEDDFCTFLVLYQDGREEVFTSSGENVYFVTRKKGDGSESVTVKTIVKYETGFLGLTRGEPTSVRRIYDFTVEPEEYERWRSVIHKN